MFQSTKLSEAGFSRTINYRSRLNLIIIPVKIEGNEYHFLFDTGAVCVLDSSLSEKISFKERQTVNVNDVNRTKNQLKVVELPELSIGGVSFRKTDFIMANLKAVNELNCLQVDGIIGANLMRKCNWKVDPAAKTIQLTTSIDSFQIQSRYSKLKFQQVNHGTPEITISLRQKNIDKIRFDSGSNGSLSISEETANEMGLLKDAVEKFGVTSSGLYGARRDTMHLIDDLIQFDSTLAIQAIIDWDSKSKGLLGLKAIGNRQWILNYTNNEIWFEHSSTSDVSPRTVMELKPYLQGKELVIGSIMPGSVAWIQGFRTGDRIIMWNDLNMKEPSLEDYCELLEDVHHGDDTFVLEVEGKDIFVGTRSVIEAVVVQ